MAGKGGRRTDQPFCLGHAPEQCSHRLLAGALRQRGGWGLGDFDVVRDSQCQSHIVAAQRVYLQIGGKGVFLVVAQNEAVCRCGLPMRSADAVCRCEAVRCEAVRREARGPELSIHNFVMPAAVDRYLEAKLSVVAEPRGRAKGSALQG